MAQVAYKLIDSTFYLEHSTTILSHIIHAHALLCHDTSILIITYCLLLYAGKEDPRWMQYVVSDATQSKRNRLFCKIMDELESFVLDRKMMGIALSLAFEMGKVAKFRRLDLDVISINKLDFLLDLVESTRQDNEESFNYEIIRLLLVFNEQFMMSQNRPNLMVDALINRLGSTTTFGENLIFMLNRSDDACVQLLILKLLYCVFMEPKLYEYFYTNDLYVLVDITLREVCDLGDDRESEALRDAYLRILKPLLINTQLRYKPYKKTDIHQVLCSLITPYMHRNVEPSSKRLAQRILEDWWEKICEQKVAPVLGVDVKNAIVHSGTGFHHSAIIKPSTSPIPPSSSPSSSSTSSLPLFKHDGSLSPTENPSSSSSLSSPSSVKN
ncbi:uncharacterized protein BX664DRAFT_335010 [Halteromyces radiatus]|uniref:uncharacterized protein n=1 Tax=Halteromyces radiatus TaxID=101107 RepID=UPI00221E7526|nr:uncharacterized protein BX664DRAFT_335010 [Halteromyces radiatus]KAI8086142.1 hypothetical protein BX664DRAFT_335010 [Halteromyces radiatus]